jgi:hypothetical protein|tara:strand:- start:77 stop:310 length:234 start_codon:yes stop_codon:yes gene_type:complete
MDSFTVSMIITVCYLVFKFTELKITQAELLPLKQLFKESFIVFISSLAAFFVYEQFYDGPSTQSGGNVSVFTDKTPF